MRVVDAQNEMIGILSRADALQMAAEKETDLVEISPKADPPVCKIIDYGKMLYSLQKKEKAAKKMQKQNEQKGVRLSIRIGPADLERQKKSAEKFLSAGSSVRVQLILRGREKAHKSLAFEKINEFVQSLENFGEIDQKPKFSGFQIIAIIKPKK